MARQPMQRAGFGSKNCPTNGIARLTFVSSLCFDMGRVGLLNVTDDRGKGGGNTEEGGVRILHLEAPGIHPLFMVGDAENDVLPVGVAEMDSG
jgi:hypothetical protein